MTPASHHHRPGLPNLAPLLWALAGSLAVLWIALGLFALAGAA